MQNQNLIRATSPAGAPYFGIWALNIRNQGDEAATLAATKDAVEQASLNADIQSILQSIKKP